MGIGHISSEPLASLFVPNEVGNEGSYPLVFTLLIITAVFRISLQKPVGPFYCPNQFQKYGLLVSHMSQKLHAQNMRTSCESVEIQTFNRLKEFFGAFLVVITMPFVFGDTNLPEMYLTISDSYCHSVFKEKVYLLASTTMAKSCNREGLFSI